MGTIIVKINKLDIIGLMSIPPDGEDPEKYFKILYEIGGKIKIKRT